MSAGGARLLLHLLTAAYGPSRHIALPHELGRYRGKADIAFVASRRRVYGYTAFCNGPGDVKSPRVIVTPPSSRFCPWSASRPPHYAVRRNGEPI
jgi:hypothetical protein